MAETQSNSYTNAAFESEVEENRRQAKNETKKQDSSSLLYYVEDNPPWGLSILLGLQHYLTMVGSTIALPLLLAPALCVGPNNPILGIFVSTIMFVSGMITFLQVYLGIRLPIIQGGTFAFIIPTFAILNSFGSCDNDGLTGEEEETVWLTRIREIQGAIIVASLFQVITSATGLIGWMLNWITPLTIVPTITLVGLALSEPAAQKASGNWLIAIMTAVILTIFSQYLTDVKIKFPLYRKKKGIVFKECAIFALFPILLGMTLSWTITGILTVTNALPANSTARTDIRLNIIHDAPWFYVPYPFQFGLPTVSVSSVFGMLAGVIASMIESIGDYYACARICGVPPPPTHAINRGVGIEGIGCILAGMWGTCNGTTSYSENIGAIRITGVGSRRVVLIGACLMMIFGLFGKFGAFCATIPDPVMAGVFIVVFAMITAIGLSNLQLVDLNSSRNLFVIGAPIFVGITFPRWLGENTDAIKTGSTTTDQILVILLSSSMLVGGILGLILDNTIPGTPEERGLLVWNKVPADTEQSLDKRSIYDLPFGMDFIRRHSIFEKIPVSPTFRTSNKKIPDATTENTA